MSILTNPQKTTTTKLLVANDALDGKYLYVTIADRDNIPASFRYHMMLVGVQETSKLYVLVNANDLTNSGWREAVPSGDYLGLFNPNVPGNPPPKDNEDNFFTPGDNYVVDIDGFWNFTQGNQSPDAGGENVATLIKGEKLAYNINSIWDVTGSTDLVQSVNTKQGVVVLKALDIGTDPIAGMGATQTQQALEELKFITDGLSSGSVYLGAFDPANPPINPPTDGDDVNFSQGDFFQVNVAGIWNFPLGDQTVDGNEVALTISDIIRYNVGSTWDVIPFGSGGGLTDTDDLVEGSTNFYYTEARVTANNTVTANTAKVSANGSIDTHSDVDTITVAPIIDDVLKWDGSNFIPGVGAVPFTTQVINHNADGALNVDFSLGVFVVINLTANITTLTFTATDGKGQLKFKQDVIGNRVVSFSGLESIDGVIPDYSTSANASSLLDVTIADGGVIITGMGNLTTIA